MSVHPKAEGITRIRISFPRPVDGTGAILAVYGDGTEDQVGTVVRTVNRPGSSAGWSAVLWADHPASAEGHLKWSPRAADLARSLTESVKAKGPWWE